MFFCWIHENFVDICLEIKVWDLTMIFWIDNITMVILNGLVLAWVSKTFLFSMKLSIYILFGQVIMADFS